MQLADAPAILAHQRTNSLLRKQSTPKIYALLLRIGFLMNYPKLDNSLNRNLNAIHEMYKPQPVCNI